MTSLLLEEDFTAGECTCFVCWGGGGVHVLFVGGGGGLSHHPRLWWLFPWWTGCRITCLLDALRKRTPQTFENCLWHFFRKWLFIVVVEERLFRLWCMCATAFRAGSRSFRAGSRMTLSFQYRSLVHPKWACFRCRTSCYVAVLPRGCYPTNIGNNKPPGKLARFSTGKSGALHNDFAVAFFNVCVICFKLLQLARERTWTL